MTVVLTVLILGVMITAHELGHFLAAKLGDVRVHEFALGMGPKLLSRQLGETTYSIRAIPVGGFVRMAGEEPGDEDDDRGLDKKSPWIRMFIMGAGVLMNFLLAAAIFAALFYYAGVPSQEPVIGEILAGKPAAEAGLMPGDRIISVDNNSIDSWSAVVREIRARPQQTISLLVERDGERLQFHIQTLVDEVTGEGFIGIGPQSITGAFWVSIVKGLEQTWWFIDFIVSSLVLMVTGKIAAQGAGPLGIAQMVGQVAQTGIINTLSFVAVLSINVGIFNLLPIPPLDGSRLVFLLVEVLRGKPIDPERENFIYLIGFALLIVFVLLVTFQDLQRLNVL